VADGLLLGGHGSDDVVVADGGAGSVGEGFDGAGDRELGLEDLDGGVGLLAGALDADQRDDGPGGADAVKDPLEVRRSRP
jgi:hypothetical protein